MDPAIAAGDKDLVRQLESTVIHWTRQIKNVVNTQDRAEGDAGPLAEIALWRARAVDLTGLRAQLDSPGVRGVLAVLSAAKSAYEAPFMALSEAIATEAMVAESNVEFLSLLEAPCLALAEAEPLGIPPILPKLLTSVRIIWNISRFYNTPERLVALLRRVSNEVIARSRATVVLSDLFDGQVGKATNNLREAIAAGDAWRKAYEATAAAVAKHSTRPWAFDSAAIFAHSDAFVQRSKDLLEVAEALLQFAPTKPLPVFGGTRGPSTTKALLDVQAQFRVLIAGLEKLDYDVLDPKNTRWHDDYATFRSGVKELENTVTRAMSAALEGAGALPAQVDLLVAFTSLAKREAVKRFVEKAMAECVAAHSAELNAVRKQFDSQRQAPPLHPLFPHYAGAALWAAGLERRLEKPIKYLLSHASRLPQAPELQQQLQELAAALEQTQQALATFARSRHGEWFTSMGIDVRQRLDTKLLTYVDGASGIVKVNFDKSLLAMLEEARLWGRLRYDVPVAVTEIGQKREMYRLLREGVLGLAREYNAVLLAIDPGDTGLFADRLKALDKRVLPGLQKLTWELSKRDIEFFVREAKKGCAEAAEQVALFKAANARINALCQQIADTPLVLLQKKHLYHISEFQEKQEVHREEARGRFQSAAVDIREQLEKIRGMFAADGDDVQVEWKRFTQRVDKRMEDALRATVKRSLMELSRALNGDARTEVVPIFITTVVLNPRQHHCELQPSLQDILSMIHQTAGEVITVTKAVPRLCHHEESEAQLPEFFDAISNDEETTLKARGSTAACTRRGLGLPEALCSRVLTLTRRRHQSRAGDCDHHDGRVVHPGEGRAVHAVLGAQVPPRLGAGQGAHPASLPLPRRHATGNMVLTRTIASGLVGAQESYMRRYEKAKKPLTAYETDITRYKCALTPAPASLTCLLTVVASCIRAIPAGSLRALLPRRLAATPAGA